MDVPHVKQLSLPKQIHYELKIISTHASAQKATRIGSKRFSNQLFLFYPITKFITTYFQ